MKTTEARDVPYQLDPECQLPLHLVELFLRSAPEQLQQLVELCTARDAEAARAQAHKLKGGLYAVGATHLAGDVEALRIALTASDWPDAQPRLQAIRREFAAMLAQLARRRPMEGA